TFIARRSSGLWPDRDESRFQEQDGRGTKPRDGAVGDGPAEALGIRISNSSTQGKPDGLTGRNVLNPGRVQNQSRDASRAAGRIRCPGRGTAAMISSRLVEFARMAAGSLPSGSGPACESSTVRSCPGRRSGQLRAGSVRLQAWFVEPRPANPEVWPPA